MLEKEKEAFDKLLKPFGMEIDGIAFLNMEPESFMTDATAAETWSHPAERVYVPRGSYLANYTWIKASNCPVRIELMQIKKSPLGLHTARGSGLIHGSFKLPDYREYHAMLNQLEEAKFKCVCHFVADYGLFSYWEKDGLLMPGFLKPRVNLRDMVAR